MAITMFVEPDSYQPIHTPIVFLLGSTISDFSNFKYRFRITVGAQERSIYVSPRPSDAKGEIDISRHLRDFLDTHEFDIENTSNSFTAQFVKYQVVVDEVWTDAGVTVTNPSAYSFTDNPIAYNSVLNRTEWVNFTPYDYKLRDDLLLPLQTKILLSRDSRSGYHKDDVIRMHIVGDTEGIGRRVRIVEYDAAGGINIGEYITITNNSKCVYFFLDLSNRAWVASTKSFSLQVFDLIGNEVSLMKTFDLLDAVCSSFDNYRFIYIDSLGSYDCINLSRASTSELNVKSTTFDKREDYFSNLGSERIRTVSNIVAFDSFTANTDNLKTYQTKQVEELILSNNTFLDVRNMEGFEGINYIPVIITTTKLKRAKSENQEIPQYTISFVPAYNKRTR